LRITGIINNVFRPRKTLKKTKIKLYSTLALPTLSYSSENWTIKARNARRVAAAEVKYLRKTAGYTWTDRKTNTEIAKELNITPVLDKIQDQEKLDTCKSNATLQTTQTDKKLHPKRKTFEETSGCTRPEWVNKWPNSLIAT
jgi:hypothetical protein